MNENELRKEGYCLGWIASGGTFVSPDRAPTLNIRLMERDHETLLILQGELGGVIYGVYESNGRRWLDLKIRGKELYDLLKFLDMYLPQGWKRTQYEEWVKKARPVLAKQRLSIPNVLAVRVRQHPKSIAKWQANR